MHTKQIELRGRTINVSRIAWINEGNVCLEHPTEKNARKIIKLDAFLEAKDSAPGLTTARAWGAPVSPMASYGAGRIKRFHICEGDFIEMGPNDYPVRNLGSYRFELPF